MKLNFHTDPGHGWLEVDRAELTALGLDASISEYSYVSADGTRVFLEEDCDAPKFIEAFHRKTFTYPEYTQVEHGNDCRIRRMRRYQAGGK